MRHPNNGLSEDDLSRLTGSSSESATCCSQKRHNTAKLIVAKSGSLVTATTAATTVAQSSPSSLSSPTGSSRSSSASNSTSSEASISSTNTSSSSPTSIPITSTNNVNKLNGVKAVEQENLKRSINKNNNNNDSTQDAHLMLIKNNNNNNLAKNSNNKHNLNNGSDQIYINKKKNQYLPELINPLEWQKSRKRKECLDSASLAVQDRKLQRSNSEELPPATENNVCSLTKVNTVHNATEIDQSDNKNIVKCVLSSEDFNHNQNNNNNNIKNNNISENIGVCKLSTKNISFEVYEQVVEEKENGDIDDKNGNIDKTKNKNSNVNVNNEDNNNRRDKDGGNINVNCILKKEGIKIEDENDQSRDESSLGTLKRIDSDENDASIAKGQVHAWTVGVPLKDMTYRASSETSPARSQRHSPIHVSCPFFGGHNLNSLGSTSSVGVSMTNTSSGPKYRDNDDSECEHERRRSSERFCKSRAPNCRKASGVTKKTTIANIGAIKYLPSKFQDENVYKYDLSTLKYERRGFIIKKVSNTTTQPPVSASISVNIDQNDNNLIDFSKNQTKNHKNLSSTKSGNGNGNGVGNGNQEGHVGNNANGNSNSNNSNHNNLHKIPLTSTAQDSLPWDRCVPEDQTPILSRRYATVQPHPYDSTTIDKAAILSKVKQFPQPITKQSISAKLLANVMDDDDTRLESLNTFRALTSLENIRTREIMQVIPQIMAFQSPEERMKQINKRVTALKRKLVQLEESYEQRMGYRPSQADRLNDRYMKNLVSELGKLRKERHELKTDPLSVLGLKNRTSMQEIQQKLERMRSTLREIEQTLEEKRKRSNRPVNLDDLRPDQLVEEKTDVQHVLLHFESLYGRPSTKDERDVARPLYDRYRQLKKLVLRTVSVTSTLIAAASELPTILEHEAMVFESAPTQYSSNNSTDTTNSPTEGDDDEVQLDTQPTGSSDNSTATVMSSSSETPSKDENITTTNTTNTISTNENIGALSLEQLCECLNQTREEKKLLRRTILEFEAMFEQQNGRKMLKNDRRTIEDTYNQFKDKKAKTRLLQALIKKHITNR